MASLSHGAAIAELTKEIMLIPPQDVGAATTTSSAVDMAGFSVAEFEVMIGNTTGTVDAKVQSCATSGGSYADITGAATSQWAANEDNTAKVICVVRPTNEFLKLVVVSGAGGVCLLACMVHLYGVNGLAPVTLDSTIAELVKVQQN